MAQKENTYRVGFGRIRLGFDQAVTASEGLTPEEVRNIIDAEVDKIYINENENQSNQSNLKTITKNNHTYVLPEVVTYNSTNPIKKTATSTNVETFSLEHDDTLQVVNGKLSVVNNSLTADPTSAVSITNNKLDVKTGNTITKSNDGKLNVKVKAGDKLLTQSSDGVYSVLSIAGPVDTTENDISTRQYTFKGVGNAEIGTISIPLPSNNDNNHKISSMTFDTTTKKLVIVESNPNGTDTTENRAEVVIGYPIYTAGTAISITNNAIAVKYDNSTIKTNANGQLYCDVPVNNAEPIIIGDNNTLGLNYNTEQFELTGSTSPKALSIKSTVVTSITDPISAKVTEHTNSIATINTTLGTKTDKTYVDGELDKKLSKTTETSNGGKYLTVDANGNIVFTTFPLDNEEIEAFKNLDGVLTYKGIVQGVSSLPSADNSETGDFYYVNTGTQAEPHYAEYVFSEDTGAWEKFGDKEPVVYTAGNNISINGSEIACTIDTNDFAPANTTYTKTEVDNSFLTKTEAANTYLTSAPEYTSGDNYINVNNTNHTISVNLGSAISNELTNYYTKSQTYSQVEVDSLISGITDNNTTYTAGTGISIDANNEISCTVVNTDTTYTGDGTTVTIDSNNVISANIPTVPDMTNYYTKSQVYNKTDIDTKFANLQDSDTTYTAGANVQISNQNVISATDTKYTGDGTTITIDNNNVISANIPDTSNYATSQSISLFKRIRVYAASGISNSLSNIDTTDFVANDFVVITNVGNTLSYYANNSTKTIYGPLDFDLMFRWTGTEFRPMFYSVH